MRIEIDGGEMPLLQFVIQCLQVCRFQLLPLINQSGERFLRNSDCLRLSGRGSFVGVLDGVLQPCDLQTDRSERRWARRTASHAAPAALRSGDRLQLGLDRGSLLADYRLPFAGLQLLAQDADLVKR